MPVALSRGHGSPRFFLRRVSSQAVLRMLREDVPEVIWAGLTRLRADRGVLSWICRPVWVASNEAHRPGWRDLIALDRESRRRPVHGHRPVGAITRCDDRDGNVHHAGDRRARHAGSRHPRRCSRGGRTAGGSSDDRATNVVARSPNRLHPARSRPRSNESVAAHPGPRCVGLRSHLTAVLR